MTSPKIVMALLSCAALSACSGTGPTLTIDSQCRNAATLSFDGDQWGLNPSEARKLPGEWSSRDEIVGSIRVTAPDMILFIADGVEVELTNGPIESSCVAWTEPTDAGPAG